MIRLAIIVILVSLFASSVYAGTWRDDFEDGNLDDWEGPDGCWKVENGECSGEYFNVPIGSNEIWIGDTKWKDYTIRCRMKFLALSGFVGISFRITGLNEDRYGFQINAVYPCQACNNTVWGWKVFQGAGATLSEIPLPFNLSKDIWYDLKIIVEGDSFKFYIDEKLVNEFVDKSISSGKVGFYVGNEHAHFDDLIVSGGNVNDGGNWDVEPKGKLATAWGKIKSN